MARAAAENRAHTYLLTIERSRHGPGRGRGLNKGARPQELLERMRVGRGLSSLARTGTWAVLGSSAVSLKLEGAGLQSPLLPKLLKGGAH